MILCKSAMHPSWIFIQVLLLPGRDHGNYPEEPLALVRQQVPPALLELAFNFCNIKKTCIWRCINQ